MLNVIASLCVGFGIVSFFGVFAWGTYWLDEHFGMTAVYVWWGLTFSVLVYLSFLAAGV
jgi:hypothetical protein